MKKQSILIAALLMMGTAAFAQDKSTANPKGANTKPGQAINTSRSNIKHNGVAVKATPAPAKAPVKAAVAPAKAVQAK